MNLYRNPIAKAGDFADPFVLRHSGRYFLYATNPDVRCWSSDDLVNWAYEGPTIAAGTFDGLVPFAPEVIYADGAFFMYTSPSGFGHIVLRADAPTGPFVPVTGNVGHAIDGNVFVDDDGARYFYWAGDEGIWGCRMPSPTKFGEPVFTGIHMDGWTEGPFVSKRNGVYQMTLTGNHYLSRGYRIDGAASDNPLYGFQPAVLNPMLVGADGPATGVGHSSSVAGPDLVSTWMIYHNINPDASRDLDIDRQVGVGRSLMVLGPTTSAPRPVGPDETWSSNEDAPELFGGPFTAELNLTALAHAENYEISVGASLEIHVDLARGMVQATAPEIDASAALLPSPSYSRLHSWTFEHDGAVLKVRLDGRSQFTFPFVVSTGSRIVVAGDSDAVQLGYCAMTRSTPAIADREAPKPVPGRFWAGQDESGSRLSVGATEKHLLHVQRGGLSRVYLAGRFSPGDAVELVIGDDERTISVTADVQQLSATVMLAAGPSSLEVRGLRGSPSVRLVTIGAATEPASVELHNENAAGWSKRVLTEGGWDDFLVTARVRAEFDSPDSHADVLLRASQLADGGDGADAELGTDFLLGYSVQLHPNRIVLARHDYNTIVLAEAPASFGDSLVELSIRALDSAITVTVDGHTVLEADDTLPYSAGAVGLRTANARLHIAHLRIASGGHPQ